MYLVLKATSVCIETLVLFFSGLGRVGTHKLHRRHSGIDHQGLSRERFYSRYLLCVWHQESMCTAEFMGSWWHTCDDMVVFL